MSKLQSILLFVGIIWAVIVFVLNMFCMEDKYKLAKEYTVKQRWLIWFAILLWPLTTVVFTAVIAVVGIYIYVREFFTWPLAQSLDKPCKK